MFVLSKALGDKMFFLRFPSMKEVFQYFVTYLRNSSISFVINENHFLYFELV